VHKLRFFICCLFLFAKSIGIASEYKFEGYFNNHDRARLVIVSLFLPYNPIITAYSNDPQVREQCSQQWQKGIFYQGHVKDPSSPCDFLWVDDEGNELQILEQYCDNPGLKVIYTSTTFRKRNGHYTILKRYLESRGFVLLSHWYWEGKGGNAIFLRKDIFDTAMRSWNYSPAGKIHSVPIETFDGIERFFKRTVNKGNLSHMEEVDFIYMINLDERPEKFTLASGNLNLYGIYPYRFSAVNGWKLPLDTIRQVGVPFTYKMTEEQLMGSVHKEVDGKQYISNELINKEGEMYFSLGLTRGAIGCILSHLSVLQDAYDSGYKTIWVIEDDIEILDNPWSIPELIRKLDYHDEDWDILFTDPDTKSNEGNYVPCRSIAARPNFEMNPLSYFLKYFYPVDQELSRIGMRYGTYSMIFRRSGIKKVLEYFKSYRIFLPYDMDFWLIPDLKMYCPNKAIISHLPGAPTDNGRPNYVH
jgi:GR25 family glycosyltransferase involved in LPS biosynthesis